MLIVVGHNDSSHSGNSHSGNLKRLHEGDAVFFEDADGNRFHYEVAEIEILSPDAVEEMTEDDGDLTLFTCTLGGGSRVTVRCVLTESALKKQLRKSLRNSIITSSTCGL